MPAYISYFYQNIFCLGGMIDNYSILNKYKIDCFDCFYDYNFKIERKIISQEENKFEILKKNVKTNTKDKDIKNLIIFENYIESKEFQSYLKDIDYTFISGELNIENELKISSFEDNTPILISIYESLKDIISILILK